MMHTISEAAMNREPDNPMAQGILQAYEAIERRDVMAAMVWRDLVGEFMNAALREPDRMIATPAYKPRQMPMADVFLDELAGHDGAQLLGLIIRILARSPRGCKVLAQMAKSHADFHWADAVQHELEHPYCC